MENKKLIFLITLVLISTISTNLISASTCPEGIYPCDDSISFGTFKQGENINLNFQCQNSTYLNISKIYTNQNIYINSETITTKSGDNYNYTFLNSSELNTYYVRYHCDLNGIKTPVSSSFIITTTGKESPTGITFIFFYIIIFILFFIYFFYAVNVIMYFLNLKWINGKPNNIFYIKDLLINWGGYIFLLLFFYIYNYYVANPMITRILSIMIYISSFTNLFLAVIALLISMVYYGLNNILNAVGVKKHGKS